MIMEKNIIFFPLIALICASCAIRSADQVVNRGNVPAVAEGVAVSNSEIREMAFNRVAGESGHKDLHIRGMLFTKKDNGGNGQISPCSGCVVMLKGISDTSVVIRMTTETDGYFSFHGQSGNFVMSLNNPGHNTVVIEPVEFDPGGVTSVVLVNASGNNAERFRVTHSNRVYTWTKD
jgi:hypothetical protein